MTGRSGNEGGLSTDNTHQIADTVQRILPEIINRENYADRYNASLGRIMQN